MPARPRIDSLTGLQCKDPQTGKLLWTAIIEIRGKAERERFQAAALAAIETLIERVAP